MPASSGLPVRSRSSVLFVGFAIYAVLILGSMATMSIGAAILGACALACSLDQIKGAFASSIVRKYAWISAALAIACLITLLVSKSRGWTFAGQTHEFSVAKQMGKAWYLVWPIVLMGGFRALSDQSRATVIRVWIVTFTVISAIGISQYFTGWPRPQVIPGSDRYHATIFFGHHLSTASILIFPLFASLDALVRPEIARWIRLPRWLLAIGVLLGTVCLFFSFSRMLWVALPVGLIVWTIWVLQGRMRWAVIAGVAIACMSATQIPIVRDRLNTSLGIGDRQALWQANIELFQMSPWVGTGWLQNEGIAGLYMMEKHKVTDVFAGHAHNNLLHMVGGTGILGTIPWLLWCLFIFLLLFRAGPVHPFFKGFVCAWLVFHVNGLTQVNFWEGKVLHQMMWVIGLSLFFAAERESREGAAA